jgi:hypothetical protein
LEFMRGYLLRSDLHIARSGSRSQSCYGRRVCRRSKNYCTYPRIAHRVVVIAITRKLRGQIPASMLERVIQERPYRATLGLNVRHDLDV